MNPLDVLFVHNNFPAQYKNLAEYLRNQPNVRVKAISMGQSGSLPGVEVERYRLARADQTSVHAFARRFDQECRRAEQVMYAANALKVQGFDPALIYVHPGWGESLPLRTLFPKAIIVVYAEFYYRSRGADVGFDREFGQFGVDGEARVALRNAATLLALADADLAIAPMNWQRSVFPTEFRPKIEVIHDGIDTDALRPDHDLKGNAVGRGSPSEEIVTYVARNLEPYRGFHVFMRALPAILRARPKAQVYIIGGDKVSYGNAPVGHKNWREAMLSEVGSAIDLSRVHFTGSLAYDDYLALLRRSRVHIYLTYPFVLSWSMLEAMSVGCLMLGSETPPVMEVIQDGVNGLLTPFGDPLGIAERVIETLAEPKRFTGLREAARQTVIDRYDLRRVVLPAQRSLINKHLPSLFSDGTRGGLYASESLQGILENALRGLQS